MSCWVVPTVAAELWGVTVQQVLDAIHSGSISIRQQHDFTFVDVAPGSPTVRRPKPFREPHPPTYAPITDEELCALMSEDAPEPQETPSDEIAPMMSDEMAALIQMGDWRRARRITSGLRKPPRPAAA